MLRPNDTSIRRHPDGSLDIAFYGSRAMQLRSAARTDAMKRIIAAVKAGLARLRRKGNAGVSDQPIHRLEQFKPSPRATER